MLTTKPIVKDDGYGPYLFTLQYKHPKSGEMMISVFSTFDDMNKRRGELAANHIETTWDIGLDYMRRAS